MIRRLYTLVSVAATLGLLLAACATPTPTSAPPAEQPTEAPAEQPTEPPAEQPTEAPAAATEAPTEAAEPLELIVGVTGDGYQLEGDGANLGRFPLNVHMTEPLVRLMPDFSVEPWLAESWEQVDDTTWLFHIRQGVKFHNGDEVNAEAVKWSIDMTLRYEPTFPSTPDDVSVVDQYTVQIVTASPYGGLPRDLGFAHWYPIYSPEGDPGSNPIGTGPFVFGEYRQNEFLRVTKFDDYWREPAGVDAITFRFVPDATARIQALAAGDVDMIVPVPLDNVAEVEALADVQILISEPVRVRYIAFATKDQAPPYDLLTDERLRKAINYAIDRDSIANDVFSGLASPAVSMAYLPAVNDQLQGYPYDPDQAAALLAEAGWADADGDGILDKDGQPLHLVLAAGVPSAAFLAPLPEVIQDQLRDVGIDVEIAEFNDEGAFYDFITEVGEFHMIMEEAGARHDLISLAYNFYCGCNPEGEAALYKRLWLTEEFDQTVELGRALPGNALDGDPDALAAALRLGQIMVDEFTIGAPIVYTPGIAAAHNYVTNFDLHPRSEFHQDWSGVTIER